MAPVTARAVNRTRKYCGLDDLKNGANCVRLKMIRATSAAASAQPITGLRRGEP